MSFDIINFIKINRRFLIWLVFFGLLYLLRGLFGLIFLTFILCFISNNIIGRLDRWTRVSRRIWTVLIYVVFVGVIVTVASFIGPKLGSESSAFIKQMPQTLDKVHLYLDSLERNQPRLAPLLDRAKEFLALESLIGMDKQSVVNFAVSSFNRVTHYFSYFLVSIIFSFLILMDYPRLKAHMQGLRQTRLKEIYEQTAESIIQFAQVVGAAFQAQIMIAMLNTMLTACGLYVLGIHPISLLSAIVFFCGLIPVLGVFISSAPIILLAVNIGGLKLALAALILIIIIHIIEAYILNPNVYSAVLKINPVFTLIILYLGGSFFGIWGILLGVPVALYFYRYTIHGSKITGSGETHSP